MNFDVIIYVLLIDLLAIISPGPDFFLVLKNSLAHSPKAGLYTTLGVTLGSTCVFSIGLFGVSLLLADSHIIFNIIKYTGAAYLCYLALKSIFGNSKVVEPKLSEKDLPGANFLYYFKMGLLGNITNPKAFMFIISLSTYVAVHGHVLYDGIPIIVASALSTLIWFCSIASIFGTITARKIFYRYQHKLNILFGLILLYVAFEIVKL